MAGKSSRKYRSHKSIPFHGKNKKHTQIKSLEKLLKGRETESLTKHHRRPRSLDGKTTPENISNIPISVHKAWHIIVGNMNPEQICNMLNKYFKPKGVTLICKFINGSRCIKMGDNGYEPEEKEFQEYFEAISLAWNVIFPMKGTTFAKKIEYINNILLDPAYHIYIRD